MTAKGEVSASARWLAVVLIAIAAVAAAAAVLAGVLGGTSAVREAFTRAPLPVAGTLGVPLVATLLAAMAMRSAARAGRGSPAARDAALAAAAPSIGAPAAPGEAALQLLALLQQEGRFVDFIEEDLGSYSDEQIGAAVRSIHEGCRSALRDRVELRPILAAAEGATVTVERGFDPAAVRVTGNVRGEPPYRGVLRHPGWRSDGVKLPEQTGDRDASIVAPAEVEVL
jgi:hypothetical protein